MSNLELKLTLKQLYRIAEILDSKFERKTVEDVDIVMQINSFLSSIQEENLNQIVRIQELKKDFWDESDKKLYSGDYCGVCGQQMCICG